MTKYVSLILYLNCFLSAAKQSTPPSAVEPESKMEPNKTVSGMEGRWPCFSFTFKVMCYVHLDNGFCFSVCSLPSNWAYILWPLQIVVAAVVLFSICFCCAVSVTLLRQMMLLGLPLAMFMWVFFFSVALQCVYLIKPAYYKEWKGTYGHLIVCIAQLHK